MALPESVPGPHTVLKELVVYDEDVKEDVLDDWSTKGEEAIEVLLVGKL